MLGSESIEAVYACCTLVSYGKVLINNAIATSEQRLKHFSSCDICLCNKLYDTFIPRLESKRTLD